MLAGKDAVIPNMIGAVGPLDTMHLVSNVTYRTRDDGWLVEAYAQAQHFLPGEGPDVTRPSSWSPSPDRGIRRPPPAPARLTRSSSTRLPPRQDGYGRS